MEKSVVLRGFLFVPLWLLAACSTVPFAPNSTPVGRAFSPQFVLEGRLAFSSETQSAHMGLFWQHELNSQWLDMRSPLGHVLLRIEEKEGQAQWTDARGGIQKASDLDALAMNALGFPVPVKALAHWVQATPLKGEIHEVDTRGRPLRIVEAGWTVRYLAYADDENPSLAPVRQLEIERGEWQLRLVVDHWEAGAKWPAE
jgi:outer membrane lipoprotein LolB